MYPLIRYNGLIKGFVKWKVLLWIIYKHTYVTNKLYKTDVKKINIDSKNRFNNGFAFEIKSKTIIVKIISNIERSLILYSIRENPIRSWKGNPK